MALRRDLEQYERELKEELTFEQRKNICDQVDLIRVDIERYVTWEAAQARIQANETAYNSGAPCGGA
jgi:hypothetical protein